MIVEYKPHQEYLSLMFEDVPDVAEAFRAAEYWQSDSSLRRVLESLMYEAMDYTMPSCVENQDERRSEWGAAAIIFEGRTAAEILQLLKLQARYGQAERAFGAIAMLKMAHVEFDEPILVVPIAQSRDADPPSRERQELAGSFDTAELYLPSDLLDAISA